MMKKTMKCFAAILFNATILFAVILATPLDVRAVNLGGQWEMDGFIRNNTGIWTENWDYADNNDPLATCRNWLRLNLNGRIIRGLALKAEVLAAYEPEYHRENNAVEKTGDPIRANKYNSFDWRELRLDWTPVQNHEFRFGRQIVNWGESLSARVGDVINPQDKRFDLGFTNLEDTRMPIWMVRGMHQFNRIGLGIDWIFSPYLQPDRYRVDRTVAHNNGNVDPLNGTSTPLARFSPYPETRLILDGREISPSNVAVAMPILYPALNKVAYVDMSGSGGPYAPALARNFGPITYAYPGSSIDDSRYGFKTISTLAGWQTGVYFWRGHEFSPVFRLDSIGAGPIFNFTVLYDRQNVYGAYANKNFRFGVLRLDTAFRPNRTYQTMDDKYADMTAEKNNLLFQVGLDKTFMWPSLNPNSTFSFTFEYVGDFILEDDLDGILASPIWYIPKHKDSHTFFMSAKTDYGFGKYTYALTAIYNVRENGLVQPSFTYVPDFLNRQMSFKLAYSNIFGKDDYAFPYGVAREKDMVILTTEYSF